MKKGSELDGVDESLRNDIKLSIMEGSFGTIMGTLIGGAFLTGFALILGANNFIIGILASIPLLANLVQIVGSYIIARMGNSKKVCIIYVFLHRLLWISILILPFFVFRGGLSDIRIWIFVVLLGIASICASITSVSWMSWMSDLIPREIRGRFFARRNTAVRIVGMLLAVAAGRFLDYWNSLYTGNSLFQSYGFTILFAVGTVAGFISIVLMRRMSDPEHRQVDTEGFIKKLKLPLQDKNFKRFILFSVVWGFSVSIVGPFFNVYMIKNLDIPFSLISLFGVAAGVSAILGLKFIGKLSDEYGPKPLLFVCGIGGAVIPFLWIFATPDNYAIIWFINILSGACWAGIGLASSYIMMNLAPVKHNSVYFAVFAAVTGVFGAFAPIFGGFLGVLFNSLSINLG
ncbi:MAG: MFS transporter, partial [Halanaerobiales bacterium]